MVTTRACYLTNLTSTGRTMISQSAFGGVLRLWLGDTRLRSVPEQTVGGTCPDTFDGVSAPAQSQDGTTAVLDGGPVDGRVHLVEPGASELTVLMDDGARHLYAASQRFEHLPDGRVVPVFEYRGREYPLRSADN